jgi:two-component system, NarL family, sensor kinase
MAASPPRDEASAAAAARRRPSILIAPEILEAEALLRATLDALSAHVAVLDETGTIIAVNQAWRSFAMASGYVGQDHGIGVNYIEVCERAAAADDDAARSARALREIIAGTRTSFRMEYPCVGPDGPRWYQLRATRSEPAPKPRIVIAHEDISDVKQAEEALARLSARTLRLQDDERRRIARELHDTTAQNLLAITLSAARLQEWLRGSDGPAPGAVCEIFDLAEQSLKEVRTLSYLLHPPLLDDIGLESALRWLAKGFGDRSGAAIETRIEDLGMALSPDVATTLFRVAQEALSNVHRHSGSKWARIALRRSDDAIELEIRDRGRGLADDDGAEGAGGADVIGLGISGMRIRLRQLGGRLELRSLRSGLLVRAVVPVGAARPGGER